MFISGVAVPVTKKKRIEEVKLALQEQMAKDSPDETHDEVLDVSNIQSVGHLMAIPLKDYC